MRRRDRSVITSYSIHYTKLYEQPFSPLAFDDFTLTALPLHHSRPTFGYLIDLAGGYRVAYLTDTVGLPEETRAYLAARTPQLVLLDCSEPPREPAPRNHNDLTRALQIHRQLGAGRTILTHIGHRLDSWLLVITSYSIHYTKLYERSPPAP